MATTPRSVQGKASGSGARRRSGSSAGKDDLLSDEAPGLTVGNHAPSVARLPDAVIDRTSPIPFHFQLSELLEQEISENRWQRGLRLPSEVELCTHFGVSRSTVRQALGRLEQEGLIGREKGRGSYVADSQRRSWLLQSAEGLFQDETERLGRSVTSRILRLERGPLPGWALDALMLPKGAEGVTLERRPRYRRQRCSLRSQPSPLLVGRCRTFPEGPERISLPPPEGIHEGRSGGRAPDARSHPGRRSPRQTARAITGRSRGGDPFCRLGPPTPAVRLLPGVAENRPAHHRNRCWRQPGDSSYTTGYSSGPRYLRASRAGRPIARADGSPTPYPQSLSAETSRAPVAPAVFENEHSVEKHGSVTD